VSNKPVQFKRKKRGKKDPHEIEIEGERFLFAPRIGTKALEPIGRLEADNITAMFQTLAALLVEREGPKQDSTTDEPTLEPEGTSYRRLVALDLDFEDELPEFFEAVLGLYGMAMGESSASSTSSDDDEASSSPTSDASTPSTSKRLKSA
jgi:hypothetical protein